MSEKTQTETPQDQEVTRTAQTADEAFADYQAMTRGQQPREHRESATARPAPAPREPTGIQKAGNFVRRHPVFTLGTAASLAAGAYFLSLPDNGNAAPPDQAEIEQSIFSLDLSEGAILRQDPHVADSADDHNALFQLSAPATIVNESRTLVFDEHGNGIWYGVGSNAIRDALADQLSDAQSQAIQDDADGIIWVNHQGVANVTHLDEKPSDEEFPPALPLDQDEK